MMAYGDANAIAMEIGEYEVLPVVEEVPVICGVHATDPRRRMWHWLGRVKEMGFSRREQFPHPHHRGRPFPRRARGDRHEREEGVRNGRAGPADGPLLAWSMSARPEEAIEMAKAGADAIIAHVGTTVGGSIGVTSAVVSLGFHPASARRRSSTPRSTVRKDIFFLCHGGPINTPEDAARVMAGTAAHGFVGASSLERMGVEESLTDLTRRFTALECPSAADLAR